MFTCTNDHFSGLRKDRWNACLEKFCKFTNDGLKHGLLAGIEYQFTEEGISPQVTTDWPSELQKAYKAQEQIGWKHIFYGRLSQAWGDFLTDTHIGETNQWIGKTIRLFWAYGLDLWTLRNTLVHGSQGEISHLEKLKIDRMVSTIYT